MLLAQTREDRFERHFKHRVNKIWQSVDSKDELKEVIKMTQISNVIFEDCLVNKEFRQAV